jgi:cytochrome c biogenesis protein CcdA
MNAHKLVTFLKTILFPSTYISTQAQTNKHSSWSFLSKILTFSYPLAIGFWLLILAAVLIGGGLDTEGGGWVIVAAIFWIIIFSIGWIISTIVHRLKSKNRFN